MGSLVLTGDTSGSGTITVPAVAGTFTATIGSATGTHYPFTAGTAVASTSGTSIDFTSIPSWVKRITVMFSGVSTSSTSTPLIQIGSGSVTSSGYVSTSIRIDNSASQGGGSSTSGFLIYSQNAANVLSGSFTITLLGSNTWVINGIVQHNTTFQSFTTGNVTLGGDIDRVRITTANGTDTFDAGSINILYE